MRFLRSLLEILAIPVLAAIAVAGYTGSDLQFHLSKPISLTGEMLLDPNNLSYSQYYTIEAPLKFRVNIENQDKTQKAVVIWPKEPFTHLLVLAKGGDELNTQEKFSGRLVRCMYRCLPEEGMFIAMEDFLQLLETRFPIYKEQPKLMPTMVMDTLTSPGGFKTYVQSHRGSWIGWALVSAISVGMILFLKGMKSRRSR